MTLAQLRSFVTTAKMGTFSAAALALGQSQPAVSELIARLEQELGTKLFHREKRQLSLTPAGVEFLPYAQQSVASAEQGRDAVRSSLSLGGGTATFGLLRNADYYLGANLARRFHTLYPDVRVRLIGQNSAETAADVAAGRLEAGLITLPVLEDNLDVVPLTRDEVMYITASKDRAQRPPVIEDISRVPLILYDAHFAETDPARLQINERAQIAGVRISPLIEVEYLASALSLVAEGVGDSLACKAAVNSASFPRHLYAVSFADPIYDTLALIKRRKQNLSRATRELARLAHECLVTHQRSPAGTTEWLATASATDAFFF